MKQKYYKKIVCLDDDGVTFPMVRIFGVAPAATMITDSCHAVFAVALSVDGLNCGEDGAGGGVLGRPPSR